MEPAAVAAAYDFSRFQTIADVGGSTGNMLTTILGRHEGPHGILFDMPHVVRDAPALIQQRGLTGSHPDRGRQLLRERSGWRRRLYLLARHPRLERGAVFGHPGQL